MRFKGVPKVILPAMVEQRRLAAHGRYRIKAWRITDEQAVALAEEMAPLSKCSPLDLYRIFRAGNGCILGARVSVR